jgi:CRP-like cAMP-binding protein/predicted MFS family arabinose efflux permease
MRAVHRRVKALVTGDPALRRVGLAWFIVNLAEWAYVTALAIHEYRLHGPLAVGLIGARFVPGAIAGSLLVGALTRRRPAVLLQLLAVGRCLAVAAVGVALVAHAPLAALIAVVWLDAVIAAPYRPLQASILPALAGTPRELSAAAGGVPASKALAQAAGALLGSIALAVISPVAIVAVAVVLFAAAALLITPLAAAGGIELVTAGAGGRADQEPRRVAAIRDGFRLVAERARALLLLGGARSLTRGLWTSLTFVVSLRLLHLGSAGVGVLMAAAGVGAAVSVPIALRFAGRPRLAAVGGLSFALAGLPIVLVGVTGEAVVAIACVVIWGGAFSLADSISNALIHRVVDAPRLAPSVAALESSKLLFEGIGALIAPALLSLVGIRAAVIVAGAPLPLMVVFARRPLRAIDDRASDRGRPLAALRRTPSFRGMPMLSLEGLAARLARTSVPAGAVVIRQGDAGDRFYLIDSGRVRVAIDGFAVAEVGPGGSFGEKALLRETPRTATVTAVEPASLWSLDAADFIAVVTGSDGPVARRTAKVATDSLEDVLAAVPLFGAIDRHALAAEGQERVAGEGEQLIHEGDEGDRFYVLLEGEAEVTIGGKSIRRLVAGDCFGEIALLHDVPRTATVTTIGEVRLWSLDRAAFLQLLAGSSLRVGAGSDGEPAPLGSDPEDRRDPDEDSGLAGAGLLV